MDIIFRVQRGFCPSRVDTIEFVQNTLIAHRFNALHQALAGEQTLCERGLFALCFCTYVECSYRSFGNRIGRAVNEVIRTCRVATVRERCWRETLLRSLPRRSSIGGRSHARCQGAKAPYGEASTSAASQMLGLFAHFRDKTALRIRADGAIGAAIAKLNARAGGGDDSRFIKRGKTGNNKRVACFRSVCWFGAACSLLDCADIRS